jgi:hypothetical protein
MSFRVLVVPEDQTLNGYIVEPLIEKMLAALGKPNAEIKVLPKPRVRGYDDARKVIPDPKTIQLYKKYDLWLFLPDGDRAKGLAELETELRSKGVPLICCAAVPEIEIWLLAGHADGLLIPWRQARNHPRLKDQLFDPFLAERGRPNSPGAGRKELMRQTLSNYRGLLSRCPELKTLQNKIKDHLSRI